MNIIERIQAPTPRFFMKLRNISLVLATLAASVLAIPVELPAVVLQLAGYIAVAGAAGSAVCQTVTTTEEPPEKNEYHGTAFAKR